MSLKPQIHKWIIILSLSILCVSQSLFSQNPYLSFDKTEVARMSTTASSLPEVSKTSSANSITIECSFPGAFISDRVEQSETFQYLHIEGFSHMSAVGKPALPMRNSIVYLPPGMSANIKITGKSYTDYPNFNIHPALEPASDYEGDGEPEFVIDEETYNTDAFYPSNLVEQVEEQKIRGNNLAFIQVRPVQFNPVTKTLRVYSKISIQIDFMLTESLPSNVSWSDENLINYLSNIVVNNEHVPPIGSIEGGNINAIDYLIVTTDEFLQVADSLAKWKGQMGYNVHIISRPTWTSTQVKDSISVNYFKSAIRPDYFVILGDHEDVPGELKPSDYGDFATDLYYACMDGAGDYFPDMAHGRISVSNFTEAMQVVQKIINYERSPVIDAAFYQNAVSCAQFQDDNGDGYAERRFCHTSENVRDYIQAKGYSVERIYATSSSSVNPTNFNNTYYSNGQAIPPELLRSNGFGWDGDALDIINSLNAGKFYLLHRDHGYYDGWGEPGFTSTNISSLANGNKLPVVFSLNCQTGGFYQTECFAERFLRHTNGGAVGVVAASQVSYSGYNDAFALGLFDAMWSSPGIIPSFGTGGVTSPSLTPHTDIYAMGDVLNQGLLRMMETWDGSSRAFEYTHQLFHYFGDPTTKMWTAQPTAISAFHADTISVGGTTFSISGASCSDALATLYYDGKLLGKVQLTGGAGVINLSPVYQPGAKLTLTLSQHNCRPYIAEVIVFGPPQNDNVCQALLINTSSECSSFVGSTYGASGNSGSIPAPGCGGVIVEDVWFKTIIPANGKISIATSEVPGGITDAAMAIYSGSCSALSLMACDDNSGTGLMPEISLVGQIPGDTLFIRVWQKAGMPTGEFAICAVEPGVPVASLSTSQTNCNVGEPVQLIDQSTYMPQTWEWTVTPSTVSYINGTSSTDQNPYISFNQSGYYTIKLKVTNALGTDSITSVDQVYASSTYIMCSQTSSSGVSGKLFDSGGSSGYYGNSENCTFLIDIPCAQSITLSFTSFLTESSYDRLRVYDGKDATAPLLLNASGSSIPSAVSAKSGSMFIQFTSDGSVTRNGFEADWTSVVPTGAGPVADFSISNVNPAINEEVQFNDLSTNLPVFWNWQFGDGQTSILQNPVHNYSTSGIKNIRLIVDNCMSYDTLIKTITVQGPPVLALSPLSLNVTIPKCGDSVSVPINITNSGVGDLIWSISGNGGINSSVSDDFDPSIDNSAWTSVTGGIASGVCGSYSGLNALYFNGSSTREAVSKAINTTNGGVVRFYLKISTLSAACEDADPGEEVVLEYSKNGGLSWQIINTYSTSVYPDFTLVQEQMPQNSLSQSTMFRWRQLDNSGSSFDHWAIDDVSISGTNTFVSLSSSNGKTTPANTTQVQVTFNSEGLAAGVYPVDLLVNTNDNLNSSVTLPCTMSVIGSPNAVLSDSIIDFGNVRQWETKIDSFILENIGCDTLHISNVLSSCAEYTPSLQTGFVAPNDSAWVIITYIPVSLGAKNCTLTMLTNDGAKLVSLRGVGEGSPVASVNTDSIYVSIPSCDGKDVVPITLYNTGLGQLKYTIVNGTGAGYDSTSTVRYTQTAQTTYHTFKDINLFSDSLVVLATINGDYDSPNEYVTVYIEGDSAGFVGDYATTNGQDITRAFVFTGSIVDTWLADGTIEVEVVNNNSVNPGYGLQLNTVQLLVNGTSWLQSIPGSGVVSVSDSAQIAINVDAKGLNSGTYTSLIRIKTDDPVNSIIEIPLYMDVLGTPQISVDTNFVDFGTIRQMEQKCDSIKIFNPGCGQLLITNISSSCPEFIVDTTSMVIAPKSMATLPICFTPKLINTFNCNLKIESNAGTQNVLLKGIATGAPSIKLTPDSLVANIAQCGDSIQMSLLLENTGNGPLNYNFSEVIGYDSTSIVYYTQTGEITNHLFTGFDSNSDTAYLTVIVNGDYSSSSEYATIVVEGVTLGNIANYTVVDGVDDTLNFVLFGTNLSNWIADGQILVQLNNSSSVNPGYGQQRNEVHLQMLGAGWISSLSPSSGIVAAGASNQINVTFNSEGKIAGKYNYYLTLNSDDPQYPQLFVPCEMNVIGSPEIQLNKTTCDFGAIRQGETTVDTVVVYNTGCSTLEIINISSSCGEFTTGSTSYSVSPGDSVSISLTFAPQIIDTFNCNLLIANNAGDVTVSLYGIGEGAPVFIATPDSVNVTINSCNDSIFVPVTISNSGLGNLHYSAEGGNFSSGKIRLLALTYGVDIDQEYVNTIQAINDNFTNYVLTEINTTVAAQLAVALENADVFLVPEMEAGVSSVFLGFASVLQNFVSNGGGVVFCGSGSSYISNTGLFSISTSSYISSSISLPLLDEGHAISNGVSQSVSSLSATVAYSVSDADRHSILKYGASDVVFSKSIGKGNVAVVGFDYFTYNPDIAKLLSNSIQWAAKGVLPQWLSIASGSSDTLAIGESKDMMLKFSSQNLSSGMYSADLAVSTNDPTMPTAIIPCVLNVNGQPGLGLQQTSIDFGLVRQYEIVTDSVNMFNSGCDTLIVSGITSSCTDFSVKSYPSFILPGDTISILIEFSPKSLGSISCNLNIVTNAGNTIISLLGEGEGSPQILVQPGSLSASLNCGLNQSSNLKVKNIGQGSMLFTALSSASWVNLTFEDSLAQDTLSFLDEDFSSFSSSSSILKNGWTSTSSAGYTWYSKMGSTSSSSTGPLGDHTTGSSLYLYTEASSGSTGSEAMLLSPVMDFSIASNPTLEFWSHMYGSTIGSLEIEVSVNGGSTWFPSIYSLTGQQQVSSSDSWQQNSVNLSAYAGYSQVQVRFTATRGGSFTGDIAIDDIKVSQNAVQTLVSVGDSSNVTVEINSTGLPAGTHTAVIQVNSDDPVNSVISIPVSLNVIPTPTIQLTQTVVDFGTLMQNNEAVKYITIGNIGCGNLSISNVVSSLPEYTVIDYTPIIPQDSFGYISVKYLPTQIGAHSAVLDIYTNDVNKSIVLNGTCIGAPNMVISPTALSVDILDCEGSDSTVLNISNTGTGILNYTIKESNALTYDSISNVYYSSTGQSTYHSFNALNAGMDSLIVTITVNGDYTLASEYASIYIDGTFMGLIADKAIPDGTDETLQYTFGGSQLSGWLSDGSITVEVRNNSQVNVGYGQQLNRVQLNGFGADWLRCYNTSGAILPSAQQQLIVSMSAIGKPVGTYTSQLYILSNDPVHTSVTVPCTMNVIGKPNIFTADTVINFAPLIVGESSVKTAVVWNNGCGLLQNVSVSSTSSVFVANTFIGDILPGDSASFPISFNPTAIGNFTGEIVISSNAPETRIKTSGTGLGRPVLSITPDSLVALITNCSDSVSVPFSISNIGAGYLNYSVLGSNINEYDSLSVQMYTLKSQSTYHYFNGLNPNSDSLWVEVTVNGDYTISTEYADIIIDGSNVGKIADISVPDGVNETKTFVFTGVQLVNWLVDGRITVEVDNSDAVDPGYGQQLNKVRLYTSEKGWLSIPAQNGTLSAGTSQAITAYFNPNGLNSGVYHKNVVVQTNDPLSPSQIVPCKMTIVGVPNIYQPQSAQDIGEVRQYEIGSKYISIVNTGCGVLTIDNIGSSNSLFSVTQKTYTVQPGDSCFIKVDFTSSVLGNHSARITLFSNVADYNITVTAKCVGAPSILVEPVSLYASIQGCSGTTDVPVRITNKGLGYLHYSFIDSCSWLSISPVSKILFPSQTGMHTITFDATGIPAGVHTHQLVIESDDPLQPQKIVPCTLTVSGDPRLTLANTAIDFGTVKQWETAVDTFYIVNTGCSDLEIFGVTLSKPEFKVLNSSFIVLPGDTGKMVVEFTPPLDVNYSTAMLIHTNDGDELVSMQGNGTGVPIVSILPETIVHRVAQCNNTLDYPITIKNSGNGSLIWSAVTHSTLLSSISDDFDPYIDMSLWNKVDGIASNDCGSHYGNALYFDAAVEREAITKPLNTTSGGKLSFYLKISNGNAPCESADLGEDVSLLYSVDGVTWVSMAIYNSSSYGSFTYIEMDIPAGAQSQTTQFKWQQPSFSGAGFDNWAIDEVNISIKDEVLTLSSYADTLIVNSTVDVNAHFDLAGLSFGSHLFDIVFNTNDPSLPKYTLPCEIIIDSLSSMQVVDEEINFGTVANKDTGIMNVMVYNTGCEPISITQVSTSSARFVPLVTNGTIPVSGKVAIPVVFNPLEAVEYKAQLLINSNQNNISVQLIGEGGDMPQIWIDSTYVYRDIKSCNKQYIIPITVSNSGQGVLNISKVEQVSSYSWVSVEDKSSNLKQGEKVVYNIYVDAIEGLKGIYGAEVLFHSSDSETPEVKVVCEIDTRNMLCATFHYVQEPNSGVVNFSSTAKGNAVSWSWLIDQIYLFNSSNLTYTFASEGIYEIQHIACNDNNCDTLVQNIEVMPFTPSDVSEEKGIHFDVYPNPNKGEFYVELNQNIEGAYSIEVYSLVGQLLFSVDRDNTESNIEKIKLWDNYKGVCLIKITSENYSEVKKVVVNQ